MRFEGMKEAKDWITERAPEYGGKMRFYASDEYAKAYPAIKKAWKRDKAKAEARRMELSKVRIENQGESYRLKWVNHQGYVATSTGFFSGASTFKTLIDAQVFCGNHGLIIVE